MTSPTLSELVLLQQEATPGPWEWSSYGYGTTPPKIGEDVYSASGKIVSCSDPYGYKTEEAAQNQKNAEFIAAARNFDFASLQTQYEAMRERLEAAEDIVDRSLAHFPEKKLRALAHGYRTQYPRVEEDK